MKNNPKLISTPSPNWTPIEMECMLREKQYNVCWIMDPKKKVSPVILATNSSSESPYKANRYAIYVGIVRREWFIHFCRSYYCQTLDYNMRNLPRAPTWESICTEFGVFIWFQVQRLSKKGFIRTRLCQMCVRCSGEWPT